MTVPESPPSPEERPSKTRRKRDMHELQALGVALVELRAEQLAELVLPENLRAALLDARRITSREGRRRQLQYVGRLMREVDPEPIRARLDAWQRAASVHTQEHHEAERWRGRLLADTSALDELLAARPAVDATRLAALVREARRERASGAPLRRYRELFRVLKKALEASAREV
jgi:ribosome-associated protein